MTKTNLTELAKPGLSAFALRWDIELHEDKMRILRANTHDLYQSQNWHQHRTAKS
jgi:hypothetical protein